MIGCPRDRRRARWYHQIGARGYRGLIGGVVVVGAISIDLLNRPLDLVQQVGTDFTIDPVGGRHCHRDDLQAVGIDRQVDLPPDSALARPMHTHLPFALAINYYPRGIDGDVARCRRAPARQPDRQGLGTARHLGVIGDGQVRAHPRHQGTAETCHHPVRQLEQHLQGQPRLDGDLRIAAGGTAPTGRRGTPVLAQECFIKPRRQVAPLHQGAIVLRPVGYPVRLALAYLSVADGCWVVVRVLPLVWVSRL